MSSGDAGTSPRILFAGTADFAVPSLIALCEASYSPALVLTQPDRPKGRGRKLLPTPVKLEALKRGIPVEQPESVKNCDAIKQSLEAANWDFIVVAAYGQILPQWFIDLAKIDCINVHGSILPKYRGAAPIQRAIMDGQKETGVTIMRVVLALDAGAMLRVVKEPILDSDDSSTLSQRLAKNGAQALVEVVARSLKSGRIDGIEQNENDASYAPRIEKNELKIDWSQTPSILVNKIRGLAPKPGAYAMFRQKRVKVIKAVVEEKGYPRQTSPGEILVADNHKLTVACKGGSVNLDQVVPESKSAMRAAEFVNSFKVKTDDRFE